VVNLVWRKPSQELIETFNAVVPGPPVVSRKMFGFPAAFVNGNMFMGLHQDDMVLRLGDTESEKFLKLAGAHMFEPMAGKPMHEYVVVPPSVLTDRVELLRWVAAALQYGTSLKPKAKNGKKSKPRKSQSRPAKQR
jgi:TfoX/Sxy family transcriptional regulator of competence genes